MSKAQNLKNGMLLTASSALLSACLACWVTASYGPNYAVMGQIYGGNTEVQVPEMDYPWLLVALLLAPALGLVVAGWKKRRAQLTAASLVCSLLVLGVNAWHIVQLTKAAAVI